MRYLAAHRAVECDQGDTLTAIAEATQKAHPGSRFAKLTFAPWARGETAASRLKGAVYRAPA